MDEREPNKKIIQQIHWRRFAVLASAVVTLAAIIRLTADAAGVARGTAGSVMVSAGTNALIMLVIGIAAPHAQSGMPIAPLRRRLLLIVPLALFSGLINYLMLMNEL